MKTEGYDSLDEFGRAFACEVDRTLDEIRRDLQRIATPSHPRDIAFRNYLESASQDQRAMKIAASAVQTFAHGLLAMLDESDKFSLVAAGADGQLLHLKKYSDLFAAETHVWFERYSKHGSIAGHLLDIAETVSKPS
jgi:hypothetical protein